MSEDDYRELSGKLSIKLMEELGIKIIIDDDGYRELRTEGVSKTHLGRITALCAIQIELFETALVLSVPFKGSENVVITVNALRKKMIELINDRADFILESYLDDKIENERKYKND